MTAGMVRTIEGDLAPAELGLILPHEHIFAELWRGWFVTGDGSTSQQRDERVTLESLRRVHRFAWSSRDNCTLDDSDTVSEEIQLFLQNGGGTIVDVTPPELSRDPRRVRQIAAKVGLKVVMGCGHYVGTAHASTVREMAVEPLAEQLEVELLEGMDGTGIRAGLLGELGTGSPLDPSEEKVLRAAALAQQRTGAPISVHLFPQGGPSMQIVRILAEAGADLSKVALGHLDGRDPMDVEEHLALAREGAFIEYDMFGSNWTSDELRQAHAGELYWSPPPSDQQRVRSIRELCDAGFESKVLISHDVCSKIQQAKWGGPGFELIPKYMRSFFVANGFSSEDFDRFTMTNPQTWLTWAR
jgi:phosphotriesterase-related protein